MNKSILLIGISLVLLAGCRQQQADLPRLVELDSLIAVAPDSAAALLEAIPADSLPTAADRAYHALLLTQAKYKADIHAYRLDTINLAVDYYADGHDKDKRTRSLLYKGCVLEELPQLDSAMYYYKYAEDMATQSGDTYHRGYALMRQASLFQSRYARREAIECFRQSMRCMRAVHNEYEVLYALQELGNLYLTINADSAKAFIDESIRLSLQLDSCDYAYCLASKSAYCLSEGQYHDCIMHGKEAIQSSRDRLSLFRSCNWVATAYSLLGQVDSSQKYLAMSPLPLSRSDSVLYLSTKASMRCRDSILCRLQAGNMADTLIDVSTISLLKESIESYNASKACETVACAAHEMNMAILSSIFLLVLLGLTLYLFIKRHQRVCKRHSDEIVQKDDLIQTRELDLRSITQKIHEHETTINQSQATIQHQLHEMAAKDSIIQRQLAIIQSKEQALQDSEEMLDRQSEIIKANQESIKNFAKRIESLKGQVALAQQDAWDGKAACVSEHVSYRNDLVSLMDQLKIQIVEAHKSLTGGKSAHHEQSRAIRCMLNDNFCETVIAATMAAYPSLAASLEDHELSRKDLMTICMHLAGFPNAVIRDYLDVQRDHTVTNKKRNLAKLLGVSTLDEFRGSGKI